MPPSLDVGFTNDIGNPAEWGREVRRARDIRQQQRKGIHKSFNLIFTFAYSTTLEYHTFPTPQLLAASLRFAKIKGSIIQGYIPEVEIDWARHAMSRRPISNRDKYSAAQITVDAVVPVQTANVVTNSSYQRDYSPLVIHKKCLPPGRG
jgi:hypothetical protein